MTGRVRRLLVAGALAVLAVGGVLPVGAPASPAGAKGQGAAPFGDVTFWAEQMKACGLTGPQLAALMLAPVYPETGAPGEQAPSPMTLSRWDAQSGLYAFGNTATPYRSAFWHPGVGMWQFDSAGGWNLNAATAVSTWTSAAQAATTMADRWCRGASQPTAAARRAYVWALWYGCTSGVCETIYQTIFDGTSLRNLTLDPAVGREGGMEFRSCTVAGLGTVPCSFVDPAKAQGFASWRGATYGPSPITAPFYVVDANGREHRIWAKEDTGYGTTIRADKPTTANARTSLVWSSGVSFCDRTAGKGDCSTGARVASTPWGPKVGDPFGSLDAATGGRGSITASGWAIDPDTNDPVAVHTYVNGVLRSVVTADRGRTDVAAVVPGYGDRHGFTTRIDGLGGGTQNVCSFAINVGPFGTGNTVLGCRSLVLSGDVFGAYDTATPIGNGVRVSGWGIDPDTTGPVTVRFTVDGVPAGQVVADSPRPDVEGAHPGWGPNHGYRVDVPASPGTRTVCAAAPNAAGGGSGSIFGCRTVNVPSGTPFGSLDDASRVPAGVSLLGWAIDPDTTAPIDVHVWVNGRFAAAVTAGLNRTDVGNAHPGFGPLHGYGVTVAAPASSQVCVFAIDVGSSTTNPVLGCRTL